MRFAWLACGALIAVGCSDDTGAGDSDDAGDGDGVADANNVDDNDGGTDDDGTDGNTDGNNGGGGGGDGDFLEAYLLAFCEAYERCGADFSIVDCETLIDLAGLADAAEGWEDCDASDPGGSDCVDESTWTCVGTGPTSIAIPSLACTEYLATCQT